MAEEEKDGWVWDEESAEDEELSTTEFAALLGEEYTSADVRKMIKAGTIEGELVNGRYVIDSSQLEGLQNTLGAIATKEASSISTTEFAAQLGEGYTSADVREMIHAGTIEGELVGGRYSIASSQLEGLSDVLKGIETKEATTMSTTEFAAQLGEEYTSADVRDLIAGGTIEGELIGGRYSIASSQLEGLGDVLKQAAAKEASSMSTSAFAKALTEQIGEPFTSADVRDLIGKGVLGAEMSESGRWVLDAGLLENLPGRYEDGEAPDISPEPPPAAPETVQEPPAGIPYTPGLLSEVVVPSGDERWKPPGHPISMAEAGPAPELSEARVASRMKADYWSKDGVPMVTYSLIQPPSEEPLVKGGVAPAKEAAFKAPATQPAPSDIRKEQISFGGTLGDLPEGWKPPVSPPSVRITEQRRVREPVTKLAKRPVTETAPVTVTSADIQEEQLSFRDPLRELPKGWTPIVFPLSVRMTEHGPRRESVTAKPKPPTERVSLSEAEAMEKFGLTRPELLSLASEFRERTGRRPAGEVSVFGDQPEHYREDSGVDVKSGVFASLRMTSAKERRAKERKRRYAKFGQTPS